jgi:hypothetical protein
LKTLAAGAPAVPGLGTSSRDIVDVASLNE